MTRGTYYHRSAFGTSYVRLGTTDNVGHRTLEAGSDLRTLEANLEGENQNVRRPSRKSDIPFQIPVPTYVLITFNTYNT